MRVIASGLIYDAATAPARRANNAFTGVTALADGTVLVSFRQGSSRGSADGVTAIYASGDAGETWKLRYDGVAETDWEGVAGEMRGLSIRQEPDGTLLGTGLWVDRSGPPRPFGNPDTTGLLPMRMFHTRSRDGGATWDDRRAVPTPPHLGASPCSMPVLDLPDGVRAQPYEVWKEWDDPRPAPQAAYLRLSHDGGATWPEYVTVARDLSGGRYYWDQRIAAHPATGRLVATFWTHDTRVGGPVDVHISWGSADGRTWSAPSRRGSTVSTRSRWRSAATGCWRCSRFGPGVPAIRPASWWRRARTSGVRGRRSGARWCIGAIRAGKQARQAGVR